MTINLQWVLFWVWIIIPHYISRNKSKGILIVKAVAWEIRKTKSSFTFESRIAKSLTSAWNHFVESKVKEKMGTGKDAE